LNKNVAPKSGILVQFSACILARNASLHFIDMTTVMQNTKKTAVKFCLGLLFILGPAAFCQAQGVVGVSLSGPDVLRSVPIQSSAPALGGWESTGGVVQTMAASGSFTSPFQIDLFNSLVTPVTILTSAPDVVPEPSTLSLLLAGSAALFRFGWRRRSNQALCFLPRRAGL
jgi:hypothetical protein